MARASQPWMWLSQRKARVKVTATVKKPTSRRNGTLATWKGCITHMVPLRTRSDKVWRSAARMRAIAMGSRDDGNDEGCGADELSNGEGACI